MGTITGRAPPPHDVALFLNTSAYPRSWPWLNTGGKQPMRQPHPRPYLYADLSSAHSRQHSAPLYPHSPVLHAHAPHLPPGIGVNN